MPHIVGMEQADETVARDFASGRKTEQRRDRRRSAPSVSRSARSLFVRRQAQNPRSFVVQHRLDDFRSTKSAKPYYTKLEQSPNPLRLTQILGKKSNYNRVLISITGGIGLEEICKIAPPLPCLKSLIEKSP